MELKDLNGDYVLQGVDFEEFQGTYGDDASVCRFKLNGEVFAATEDPEDGYRSCLESLEKLPPSTVMKTSFEVPVTAKYVDDGYREVALLTDCTTGLVVLEVGTENYDDYYPCFVANFTPENMHVNKGA